MYNCYCLLLLLGTKVDTTMTVWTFQNQFYGKSKVSVPPFLFGSAHGPTQTRLVNFNGQSGSTSFVTINLTPPLLFHVRQPGRHGQSNLVPGRAFNGNEVLDLNNCGRQIYVRTSQGSNPRPSDPMAGALTSELLRRTILYG